MTDENLDKLMRKVLIDALRMEWSDALNESPTMSTTKEFQHLRFVFDCLQRNTTEIRNMKQYLLAVLYNAPVTMENHYASQVNHDLYGKAA